MIGMTAHEIVRALFTPAQAKGTKSDCRIEVLTGMVFTLFMEVEALRKVLLASDLRIGGKQSVYGRAYEETAYLTHNATGPSSGLEKLLELFYERGPAEEAQNKWERRTWPEILLFRRLGFSEEEIGAYKEAAGRAEKFT